MSSISGLYSPLPQSISDSDSERELHMDPITGQNNETKRNKTIYRQQNAYSKHIQKLPQAKLIKPSMSLMRRIAFVTSIICCFLPIVIFLWILPCDLETCPVKISNWETRQDGVEMKGAINLFYERFKKHFNLAVQYKGDLNSMESLKHGVISFFGNNGQVNWYFRQSVVPERLDCSIIDVDLDGIPDCLLLDERGLKVVEVLSGETIWHVHSHEEKILIDNLQFPIVLNDLNGDGVKELLSVYRRKYLMVICGRTGRALSNIMVELCNDVEKLSRTEDFLQFQCENGTISLNFRVGLREVSEKFFDNTHSIIYEQYNATSEQFRSYSLDNYKLEISNNGTCPECSSILKLSNKIKTVYTRIYNKSYIVNPTKFKFTSKKFIYLLKGHTEGFIVKIWDWHQRFNPKRSTDYPFNFKRDNLNNTNYGFVITERVILITFNETDFNVIQASSSNITQLCYLLKDQLTCQPDIKNQENSLLIWDLDRDGSQELISYSSTFYLRENAKIDANPWQLISTIKVLKLESELPKLYDTRQTIGFANY